MPALGCLDPPVELSLRARPHPQEGDQSRSRDPFLGATPAPQVLLGPLGLPLPLASHLSSLSGCRASLWSLCGPGLASHLYDQQFH